MFSIHPTGILKEACCIHEVTPSYEVKMRGPDQVISRIVLVKCPAISVDSLNRSSIINFPFFVRIDTVAMNDNFRRCYTKEIHMFPGKLIQKFYRLFRFRKIISRRRRESDVPGYILIVGGLREPSQSISCPVCCPGRPGRPACHTTRSPAAVFDHPSWMCWVSANLHSYDLTTCRISRLHACDM